MGEQHLPSCNLSSFPHSQLITAEGVNPDCKLPPWTGELILPTGSVCRIWGWQFSPESSSSTHLYADGRVAQAQELPPAEQAAEPALQQRDPPQHLLVQQVLQELPLPFLHENLAKTTQKTLAWKASRTTSQILLVSVSWVLPGK